MWNIFIHYLFPNCLSVVLIFICSEQSRDVWKKIRRLLFGYWDTVVCILLTCFSDSALYTRKDMLARYKALWRVVFFAIPVIAIILLTRELHIDLSDLSNFLFFIFDITPGTLMIWGYICIFFFLVGFVWREEQNKIFAYFSCSKTDLRTLRFLILICSGVLAMITLLPTFGNISIQNKQNYLIVYEIKESTEGEREEQKAEQQEQPAQANGKLLGVAICQDETTMIVLPAQEMKQNHGRLYELTGDTNYMYVDKSGVVIEQISKDDIDWKNHLNVGQDSNIT